MKSSKKPKDTKPPSVNDELEGLDITINSFGEIQSTYDIDKINKFLNKHVKDKKLAPGEENEDSEASDQKEEE
jgi:hypothetical protein